MDGNCHSSSSKSNISDSIINTIPDDILLHIISFLPPKEIVQTSVLSKKWEFLWTSISNIDIDTTKYIIGDGKSKEVCLKFLDNVLTLHGNSGIQRLCLKSDLHIDFHRLESWLRIAVSHKIQEIDLEFLFVSHNIQEIDIEDIDLEEIDMEFFALETLPCLIFTCPSLVVLKLNSIYPLKALNNPLSTRLSNLKILHFYGILFEDESSLQSLFDRCPILDELELVYCGWKYIKNVTISISTLRSLKIILQDPFDVMSCLINISAPNLTDLIIFTDLSVILKMYDFSSLEKAFITIAYEKELRDTPTAHYVTNFFSAISNVKYLSMSDHNFMIMKDADVLLDQLPVFLNLTNLELHTEFTTENAGVLINFLNKAPKLEFINFAKGFNEDKISEATDLTLEKVPPCFTSCLKMFNVAYFRGFEEEMGIVGFVISYATALNKVTIYFSEDLMSDELEEVKKEINLLSKGSESCDIIFH